VYLPEISVDRCAHADDSIDRRCRSVVSWQIIERKLLDHCSSMVTSDLALSAAARLAPAISTPSYTKMKEREREREREREKIKEKKERKGKEKESKLITKKKKTSMTCKPSALCSGN